MILDNGDGAAGGHGATLDELFRRAGVRHPQATALIDPPNRESFTDGAPRELSYAEADSLTSAFAARLRALGLRTDAVVAIQLPNAVEAVIALLGVLRAGMIAAPLPLLWRQQDIINALQGTGAKSNHHLRPRWRARAGEISDAGGGRAVSDPPYLQLRARTARRRGAARRSLHRKRPSISCKGRRGRARPRPMSRCSRSTLRRKGSCRRRATTRN